MPLLLRLGQAGLLKQVDAQTYVNVTCLRASATEKLVQALAEKGLDVSELAAKIEVPVLPDLMVRKASSKQNDEVFYKALTAEYPRWIDAFWSAGNVFDNDGAATKELARAVVTRDPASYRSSLDEAGSEEVHRALGSAALLDLYAKMRLQAEGQPTEILPEIPGWAWGFGGFVLGMALGAWIGVASLEKLLLGNPKEKAA